MGFDIIPRWIIKAMLPHQMTGHFPSLGDEDFSFMFYNPLSWPLKWLFYLFFLFSGRSPGPQSLVKFSSTSPFSNLFFFFFWLKIGKILIWSAHENPNYSCRWAYKWHHSRTRPRLRSWWSSDLGVRRWSRPSNSSTATKNRRRGSSSEGDRARALLHSSKIMRPIGFLRGRMPINWYLY